MATESEEDLHPLLHLYKKQHIIWDRHLQRYKWHVNLSFLSWILSLPLVCNPLLSPPPQQPAVKGSPRSRKWLSPALATRPSSLLPYMWKLLLFTSSRMWREHRVSKDLASAISPGNLESRKTKNALQTLAANTGSGCLLSGTGKILLCKTVVFVKGVCVLGNCNANILPSSFGNHTTGPFENQRQFHYHFQSKSIF